MVKTYICLLQLAVFSSAAHSTSVELLPLEKLLATGKITAEFTSKGGYQNACMQLIVKNTSADSVIGFVEPGRKLNSADDSQQDILVVKTATFKLRKNQTDTIDVIGFCCESTK